MSLQSETRPISQDQLVNDVKGIYAGLVMVEKKCVEINHQQSKTTNKALRQAVASTDITASNVTIRASSLFLASQHPSLSAAL